jgi:TolA protein
MAALDDELGVDETADLLKAPSDPVEPEASSGGPETSDVSRAGAVVSPELARWNLDTRRRIQNRWVTPSNFRNRGLATTLELHLSASGDVIGTPKVVRSSGDPFFDETAVRAVLKAAPLPRPPKPGRRVLIFNAEGN